MQKREEYPVANYYSVYVKDNANVAPVPIAMLTDLPKYDWGKKASRQEWPEGRGVVYIFDSPRTLMPPLSEDGGKVVEPTVYGLRLWV